MILFFSYSQAFACGPVHMRLLEQEFKRQDTNNDEKISFDEWMDNVSYQLAHNPFAQSEEIQSQKEKILSESEKSFTEIDTMQTDGSITIAEYDTWFSKSGKCMDE